jgi:hypothetical protein
MLTIHKRSWLADHLPMRAMPDAKASGSICNVH